MQKYGIFGILEYSELFHNCFPMYIQNPVIFTKIDKPSVILEIQNPGILTILEYSEPLNDLRWSVLQKQLGAILIIFPKCSMLHLWQRSE